MKGFRNRNSEVTSNKKRYGFKIQREFGNNAVRIEKQRRTSS